MTRLTRGAFLTAGTVTLASACSGRSLVIGGDPLEGDGLGGSGGTIVPPATGGSDFGAGGASTFGGSSTYGGSSAGGATVTGGVGGTTGGYGAAGSSVEGGQGGEPFDPYPIVAWDGGQGYRKSCPEYPDVWGFTCWNVTGGATNSCMLSGTPPCNACSCAVPCDTSRDCPSALDGTPAVCVASATTAKSCFVSCDSYACPEGMTCADYPGGSERVCVWVDKVPT